MDNTELRSGSLQYLSPEVIASTSAKCSSCPQAVEDICNELSEESSTRPHGKWSDGYGRASVAEHACFYIARRKMSLISAGIIRRTRLACCTENASGSEVVDDNRIDIPRIFCANPHIKHA